MLKYILPVSRSAHDSLKGEKAKLLELLATVKHERDKAEGERDWARTQCDEAVKERDDAHEEYTAAVDRELHAKDIATRALVLLSKVDTTRTGGKQLKASIDTLLTDAKEHGLWGEIKE